DPRWGSDEPMIVTGAILEHSYSSGKARTMKTISTRCVSHVDRVSLLIVVAGGLIVATITGCGSGEAYAPVSGTVTLNGDALADAKLIFEPIGDKDGQTLGKPSY